MEAGDTFPFFLLNSPHAWRTRGAGRRGEEKALLGSFCGGEWLKSALLYCQGGYKCL